MTLGAISHEMHLSSITKILFIETSQGPMNYLWPPFGIIVKVFAIYMTPSSSLTLAMCSIPSVFSPQTLYDPRPPVSMAVPCRHSDATCCLGDPLVVEGHPLRVVLSCWVHRGQPGLWDEVAFVVWGGLTLQLYWSNGEYGRSLLTLAVLNLF